MVMADEVKTWTFGAERKFSDSKENLATNSTSGSISPTVPNSLSSNNCCFNSTKNEAVASPPPPPISPHHPHSHPPHHPHHPHRPDIGDANMPWFHGKITREDAEALLMPREDGLFLVRESTNFPGDYALCVCFNGRVEHYRVIYKDSQLTIDEEEYFDTLSKLVEHYCLDADGLCTRLRSPVAKSSSSSSSSSASTITTTTTTSNSVNHHNHTHNHNHNNNNNNHLLDPKAFEEAGWVIRMSELKLGEVLGKGEFGDVVLGTYRGQKVAVKKLKDSNCKAAQDYLTEASLMTSLLHRNLVQLLGVVFDGPTICVVTEFMAKGSLVDYLRSRGRLHVTARDQIAFAADTCAGMAYLESRRVIHRDLAARNVLISEEGVAKVCDFGLAKDPSLGTEGGKFPIKWTAPEALRYSRFSNKSDMWSFGILLWEIYSFGRVPYPRIQLADVVKHVEKGYRMEAPEGCPPPIYEIMTQAWEISPEKRPTFAAVSAKLNHMRENHTD